MKQVEVTIDDILDENVDVLLRLKHADENTYTVMNPSKPFVSIERLINLQEGEVTTICGSSLTQQEN